MIKKTGLLTIIGCALFLVLFLAFPRQSFACRQGEFPCGSQGYPTCCSNAACTQNCYLENPDENCTVNGCFGVPLCRTGYTGYFRCNNTTGHCESVCPDDSTLCEAGVTSCTPGLTDVWGSPVPQCGTGGTCGSNGICQTCDVGTYSCNGPTIQEPTCNASGRIAVDVDPLVSIRKERFRVYQGASTSKCDSLGGRFESGNVFWDAEGCGTLSSSNSDTSKWSTANQYGVNTFRSNTVNRDPYLIQVSFGTSTAEPVFGGSCQYKVDCQSATPLTKVDTSCEANLGSSVVIGGVTKTVNSRVMSATVAAVCSPNSSNVGVSFKTMSTITTGTPYYPMFSYFYPASTGAGEYSTTLCGGVSANGLAANTSTSVSDQIPTRYGPGTSHNLTCTVARGANSTDGDGNAQREWSFDGTTKITTFSGTADQTYKIAIDWGNTTGSCSNTTTKYIVCPNYKITGRVKKCDIGGTNCVNYTGGATLNLTPGTNSTTSNSAGGYYAFTGLSTNTYTVTLDPASIPGYQVTTPASGSYTNLAVPPGAIEVDFFIEPTARSISGSVYLDYDGSTTRGAGEPLYSGAPLNLTGGATKSTTSNNTTGYSFADLSSGSYTVTLTVPGGHTATTATSKNVSIISNNVTGIDFGIKPLSPGTPTVTVQSNFCSISQISSGNQVSISWTDPYNNIAWADISDSNTFATYYHKDVAGITSTTAPSGFNLNPGTGDPIADALKLDPGKFYYVRLYNGSHSPTTSFMVPFCMPLSGTINVTVGSGAVTGTAPNTSGVLSSDADTASGKSAKNVYNPIIINPTLTNYAASSLGYGNIDLTGVVFTSDATLNNSPLGTVLSTLNSSNKGFALLYAHCHNTPTCIYNGKTFSRDKYYVYFNGAWGGELTAPTTYDLSTQGLKVDVQTPTGHGSYSPKFQVWFYKILGGHTWKTYEYFAGWNGTTSQEFGLYKNP